MSKFMGTPGPWNISGKTVYALNGQGFNRFSALVQDAHTGDEELEANAHLISAAPDLLEALEGIMRVEARDRVMPVGAEWDAARAAIAKALGEQ